MKRPPLPTLEDGSVVVDEYPCDCFTDGGETAMFRSTTTRKPWDASARYTVPEALWLRYYVTWQALRDLEKELIAVRVPVKAKFP